MKIEYKNLEKHCKDLDENEPTRGGRNFDQGFSDKIWVNQNLLALFIFKKNCYSITTKASIKGSFYAYLKDNLSIYFHL